ncbi:MAG TPA: MOSC N-terminal beta barrel domain-containing protein [Candidatus Polarisedimenticolia bacterium]|nr:MOSC N-terminal beta barrel domain-containing protein [Candidatus Polarisedimenticolia bacterium]
MKVDALWRYPVKTMAGERLDVATLGPLGILGDRVVQVATSSGRVLTSRTYPGFLAHRGSLGADGEPRVDGIDWRSPEVAAIVAGIGGRDARLVRDDGPDRFDVLPLLVATDGAIAAFGHDGRRLRPNIVVGGVPGMTERDWPGGRLQIGPVVIGIESLRLRCVMTSFDPDTQAQDKSITKGIYDRFEGKLALDCYVLVPGTIAVGDPVGFTPDPRARR